MLTAWMEKLEAVDTVLDLRHGIVVLLFSNHELSSIGRRVFLAFRMADFKQISWRGIACFKQKISLWLQMFSDASQHRFLVRPRQNELKGIHQHINAWKLLAEME